MGGVFHSGALIVALMSEKFTVPKVTPNTLDTSGVNL
jgi:hypothetical protein